MLSISKDIKIVKWLNDDTIGTNTVFWKTDKRFCNLYHLQDFKVLYKYCIIIIIIIIII